MPLLKNNLQAAQQQSGLVGVTTKWTSNNCESLNHALKQAVDWRPQAIYIWTYDQTWKSCQLWVQRDWTQSGGSWRLQQVPGEFSCLGQSWFYKASLSAFPASAKAIQPKNIALNGWQNVWSSSNQWRERRIYKKEQSRQHSAIKNPENEFIFIHNSIKHSHH